MITGQGREARLNTRLSPSFYAAILRPPATGSAFVASRARPLAQRRKPSICSAISLLSGTTSLAMLAEVFLAGGCWLTIQLISEKHAPCSRTDNPAYLKPQSDLTHWQRRQAENRRLAGILAGKIRAINEAREQFVGAAMGYFRAAVKLAVNDKHLDDFLNR